jgi:hypothetical protein
MATSSQSTLELDYKKLGTLMISNTCYLTYPCKHNVQDMVTGEIKMMSGKDIFIYLRDQGISDKHFNIYEDYISKEKSLLDTFEKTFQIAKERQIKDTEKNIENKKEGHMYRASSRLERLKQKNNICD